jgi:hypothetical protein
VFFFFFVVNARLPYRIFAHVLFASNRSITSHLYSTWSEFAEWIIMPIVAIGGSAYVFLFQHVVVQKAMDGDWLAAAVSTAATRASLTVAPPSAFVAALSAADGGIIAAVSAVAPLSPFLGYWLVYSPMFSLIIVSLVLRHMGEPSIKWQFPFAAVGSATALVTFICVLLFVSLLR